MVCAKVRWYVADTDDKVRWWWNNNVCEVKSWRHHSEVLQEFKINKMAAAGFTDVQLIRFWQSGKKRVTISVRRSPFEVRCIKLLIKGETFVIIETGKCLRCRTAKTKKKFYRVRIPIFILLKCALNQI